MVSFQFCLSLFESGFIQNDFIPRISCLSSVTSCSVFFVINCLSMLCSNRVILRLGSIWVILQFKYAQVTEIHLPLVTI